MNAAVLRLKMWVTSVKRVAKVLPGQFLFVDLIPTGKDDV